MYSRKQCATIGRAIENAIRKRFDWLVRVTVQQDGRFSWQSIKGRDRYDLYPGMSKQQADKAIMQDITAIFRQYLPSAQLTDYSQSGRMHYPG